MKSEVFFISNLKCGGCESSIINSLLKIKNLSRVEVNHGKQMVTVFGLEEIDRKQIIAVLSDLGYPEINEENSGLLKVKSYISCAKGRFDNILSKN